MACDNHNNHPSPYPLPDGERRKGEEKKGKGITGFFARLPGILSNDRGSTGFYVVFVIFMAIVVYFKFYYTPEWDPAKPVKITAPRSKITVSSDPPGVRQAAVNDAASAPHDENAANRPQAQPKGALPADIRRSESNAAEAVPAPAVGYKVVVQKRAEDVKAEEGMYSKEGSHFTVKFDGGENGVDGHVIAILLEEAYMKVGADLNFYPTDRIEAVLYTKDQFRDVTRSPAWAGALYDGRIKAPAGGIMEKSSLLEKVLFHEYTHALVHRLSHGRAPTWLNEGLAQYEEGQDDSFHAESLREFARKGRKDFSLRSLEGSFMGLTSAEAQSAYILSLSATRYIVREFGVSAVKRILEALASGQDMNSAIRSSIYISYDDLDRSWLASLSR